MLATGYPNGVTTPALAPMSCPCGSGLSFAACHGREAQEAPSATASTDETTGSVTHGYWLVAFIDLLGQKEAFLKTDYLPDAGDAAKREAFIKQVQASVGVILGMRRILDGFQAGMRGADTDGIFDGFPPEQRELAERLRRTQVRDFRHRTESFSHAHSCQGRSTSRFERSTKSSRPASCRCGHNS